MKCSREALSLLLAVVGAMGIVLATADSRQAMASVVCPESSPFMKTVEMLKQFDGILDWSSYVSKQRAADLLAAFTDSSKKSDPYAESEQRFEDDAEDDVDADVDNAADDANAQDDADADNAQDENAQDDADAENAQDENAQDEDEDATAAAAQDKSGIDEDEAVGDNAATDALDEENDLNVLQFYPDESWLTGPGWPTAWTWGGTFSSANAAKTERGAGRAVLTVLVSWAERTVAQWHAGLGEFSRQVLALAGKWGRPLDKGRVRTPTAGRGNRTSY